MSTDSSQMLMLVGDFAHILWEVQCPLLPYGVCDFWTVCDLALISTSFEMDSHTHLAPTAFCLLPRADFSKVGWERNIVKPQQCMMGRANRTLLCPFCLRPQWLAENKAIVSNICPSPSETLNRLQRGGGNPVYWLLAYPPHWRHQGWS